MIASHQMKELIIRRANQAPSIKHVAPANNAHTVKLLSCATCQYRLSTSPSAKRLLRCVRDVEKAVFILLCLVQSTNCLCHRRNRSFIDDEIECMIPGQCQAVSVNDIQTLGDFKFR